MLRRSLTLVAALAFAACGGSDGPTGGGGGPPPPPPPPPPPAAPPGNVGFQIVDNAFVDDQGRRNANARVTMSAGEMVGWIHNGANPHTVTFSAWPDGAVFDNSGNLSNGDTHEETLATPGTYVFFCQVHPTIMLDATIIVN